MSDVCGINARIINFSDHEIKYLGSDWITIYLAVVDVYTYQDILEVCYTFVHDKNNSCYGHVQ